MSKCYQLNMNVNNVNEIMYDIKRFLMYNILKGIFIWKNHQRRNHQRQQFHM